MHRLARSSLVVLGQYYHASWGSGGGRSGDGEAGRRTGVALPSRTGGGAAAGAGVASREIPLGS